MIYPTFEFQVTWNEKQFFQDWHSCLQNIIMFVYTMSHKIVHIPFYHLYLFSVHFQPFKVFQNICRVIAMKQYPILELARPS